MSGSQQADLNGSALCLDEAAAGGRRRAAQLVRLAPACLETQGTHDVALPKTATSTDRVLVGRGGRLHLSELIRACIHHHSAPYQHRKATTFFAKVFVTAADHHFGLARPDRLHARKYKQIND